MQGRDVTARQAFILNDGRLDATSALLDPEPAKRDIVQQDRLQILSLYHEVQELYGDYLVQNDSERAYAVKAVLKKFKERWSWLR